MSNIKKNKLYYLQLIPFLFFQLMALRKLIIQENIILIHSHWLIPQGLIATLYKFVFNKKIKILVTAHGGDLNNFDNSFGKFIKRKILTNINELTVVSNALKEKALDLGYTRTIFVYPMGVDIILFNPDIKKDGIRNKYNISGEILLFVGRLSKRKGLGTLIKAFHLITKELTKCKLIIIGEGTDKEEVIKLAKELKVYEQLIFLGALPHSALPEYFATADVFILPSLSEGWPVVVMEALSCGNISIVSDLPVFTKMENNEGFIQIVEKENFTELALKTISVLKNNNETKQLKIKARQFAINNFDWVVISKKYSSLISRLLTT